MNISQVTVSVHEKRNNPYEYGHYDAEVRMTADLQPGDGADDVIGRLIGQARSNVKAECDRWIADTEEVRRIDDLSARARMLISSVGNSSSPARLQEKMDAAQKVISQLPEEMQPEYRTNLDAAIDRANKQLSQAPVDNVDGDVVIEDDEDDPGF